MPAAAHSAADGQRLGKAELCEMLGWSRPRLDRRLESDPKFPVRSRGDRAGGWAFDLEAVSAYLGLSVVEPEEEAEVVPLVRRGPVVHEGEETATQRLKTAQAQLQEDRLRRQRGELVDAGQLKIALSTAVTKLAISLNALPDQLVRRLQLPEAAGLVIRQEVDDARRAFYAELRQSLGLDAAAVAEADDA